MNQDYPQKENIDLDTVSSFGDEWTKFSQDQLPSKELSQRFDEYFHIFPWDKLTPESEGFDMGCGSGRWDSLVASRVGRLNCIDASIDALSVAQERLSDFDNIRFQHAPISSHILPSASQDFGFSLGVLHHVPDTLQAIKDCAELLKPNAPFLAYIYYDFENKPFWFFLIWKVSDFFRTLIFNLPPLIKLFVCDLIALLIYYPLTRFSLFCSWVGFNVKNIPLSYYRNCSFYTMRTDARDRFGTPLERRFSKAKIKSMFKKAGLENLIFSNKEPYWCVLAYKNSKPNNHTQ